jgi:hypothetical protein
VIQEIHPTTDKRFNRRRFTCQSGTEAQDYRKTFIADDHQLTHAVRIKWIDELHFEVWPEPLTLVEIAIRSDGFTRLSTAELRWLAAEHKVDVAKLKPEKGQTDRDAFIVALTAIAKGPPPRRSPHQPSRRRPRSSPPRSARWTTRRWRPAPRSWR